MRRASEALLEPLAAQAKFLALPKPEKAEPRRWPRCWIRTVDAAKWVLGAEQ
jgi:hypothetical protein